MVFGQLFQFVHNLVLEADKLVLQIKSISAKAFDISKLSRLAMLCAHDTDRGEEQLASVISCGDARTAQPVDQVRALIAHDLGCWL